MPNRLEKQIEIKLTSAQRAHVSQQSGLNLPYIRMQPTELELLTMVAVAAGNETLPVTPSAIKQVFGPGQNSEQGSDPFTLEVRLTSEQKEQIRQATGKRVSSLLIVPDDFSQLYTEIWDDMNPIRIGHTMVITRADSSAYEALHTDRIIELPSGDSSKQDVFGTGRHPTTQLSLMLLEEYVEEGDRVLDLGTGSGILAVAAAKLGASEVLALDVEADAVTIAQDTVAVNDLANIVEVSQGSIESAAAPYDVVAANIFTNMIIQLAPALATTLRQAGVLISCGLVVTRAKDVANAVCAAGFSLEKQRSQDDWLGMAFRKL
jgi:ribosomal protein L11 methyltransferase